MKKILSVILLCLFSINVYASGVTKASKYNPSSVTITGGTINGVAISSGTVSGAAITGGTVNGVSTALIAVPVAAGNIVTYYDLAARASSSQSDVEAKNVRINTSGTYRLKWLASSSTNTTLYTRVYKNGVLVATVGTNNNGAITYTYDLAVVAGNTVQVFMNVQSAVETCYVSDFYMNTATPPDRYSPPTLLPFGTR